MTIITKAALAAELGVTKPRVSQYVKSGLPVRSDGKLNREEALNWIAQNQLSQTHDDKGANRARKLAAVTRNRRSPNPETRTLAETPKYGIAFAANVDRVNDYIGKQLVQAVIHMTYMAPAHAVTMAVH